MAHQTTLVGLTIADACLGFGGQNNLEKARMILNRYIGANGGFEALAPLLKRLGAMLDKQALKKAPKGPASEEHCKNLLRIARGLQLLHARAQAPRASVERGMTGQTLTKEYRRTMGRGGQVAR